MKKILIIACLLAIVCSRANAGYPDRNIKVVVHVPPGGGTDSMTRLLLQYVGKRLGVSFIINNYRGAGGQLGYTALAMSEPDGYTIGTITTASIITHELTRKNVAYKFRDSFAPIARFAMDPTGLFVRSDSPFKTFDSLLRYAQKHPDQLSCGGTSLWGTHHIHSILAERVCNMELNYIPFDGGAEVRNNLLGGHIDVASGGVSEFISLIHAGKIRGLVIAGEKRMAGLPDIPTYKDVGYDLVIGSDKGLAAPAGVPGEYIDILSKAIFETLNDPEFLKQADGILLTPIIAYLDPADFIEYLVGLRETIGDLLKGAGDLNN